ncbi:MAG: hypothetical protein EPO42_06380 [Gallionellaceae bacterium]|nr:MAG: hypothetical protein EPO42_06380 [Gallionellaceae bacterium]
MRQYQKGEVTLVVMVVMMALVWMFSGHVGMMGYGAAHAEKPGNTEQQTKAEPPPAPNDHGAGHTE